MLNVMSFDIPCAFFEQWLFAEHSVYCEGSEGNPWCGGTKKIYKQEKKHIKHHDEWCTDWNSIVVQRRWDQWRLQEEGRFWTGLQRVVFVCIGDCKNTQV